MQAVKKLVSVLLQNSDEGSTYTWSGEATSYDDAAAQARADALEFIGEYPELDVVVSVTEGDAVYINEGTVFERPKQDVVHLFCEGQNISSSDEFSSTPDVVAVIDMSRVREAALILHQNNKLLDGVNIPASVVIGDNNDSAAFAEGGIHIEITSTNKNGTPDFGIFRFTETYSDISHSKGLYFNQENYGSWKRAWIDGDTVYVADPTSRKVEMRQIDGDGYFATDENDDSPIRYASVLSPDIAKELGITDNPGAYGVTIEDAPAPKRKRSHP